MRDPEASADRTPIFRDHDGDGDDQPNPDIVPEDAPRGGITVPDANDTGITTPPISGWGDTPFDDDDEERATDR